MDKPVKLVSVPGDAVCGEGTVTDSGPEALVGSISVPLVAAVPALCPAIVTDSDPDALVGSFSARSMAAVPSLCELVDPVRGERVDPFPCESAAISATLSGTVSDELGSDVEGGNSLTSVVGEVVVELRSASRGATRVVAADSFRFFSVETLTLAKMLKFL